MQQQPPQQPWPVPLAQLQPWWKPQPVGLLPHEAQALHEGRLPEGFSMHALQTSSRWGAAGLVVLIIGVALLVGGGVMGWMAYSSQDGERLGQALLVGVFGIPAVLVGISAMRWGRANPKHVQQAPVYCRVGTLRRKLRLIPRGGSLVIKEHGFKLDIDGVELTLVLSGKPVFEQLQLGARYRVYHLGEPTPLVLWVDEA